MMDDSRLTLCIKIQRKAVLAFHDLSAVVDPIDVLEAGFSCRHAAPTHTTAPCWWNTRERMLSHDVFISFFLLLVMSNHLTWFGSAVPDRHSRRHGRSGCAAEPNWIIVHNICIDKHRDCLRNAFVFTTCFGKIQPFSSLYLDDDHRHGEITHIGMEIILLHDGFAKCRKGEEFLVQHKEPHHQNHVVCIVAHFMKVSCSKRRLSMRVKGLKQRGGFP